MSSVLKAMQVGVRHGCAQGLVLGWQVQGGWVLGECLWLHVVGVCEGGSHSMLPP